MSLVWYKHIKLEFRGGSLRSRRGSLRRCDQNRAWRDVQVYMDRQEVASGRMDGVNRRARVGNGSKQRI